MPGIVRVPGRVPAGRVESNAVGPAAGLLPTVAKLAGAAAPGNIGGEDVSDVPMGASRARGEALLWEWRFNLAGYAVNRSPLLSMREGDGKLSMNPDRSRVELYNIPADPGEMSHFAGARVEIVKRVSEPALAWQTTGPVEPSAGKNVWAWPGRYN